MLTEKGKEIGRRVAGKIDAILDAASAGLSEDERVILYRSLSLIHENLLSICHDYSV